MWMLDTLQNLISGMGTVKDKATFNQYVLTVLSRNQLEIAYRADWVARKAIDIPAYDSTRQWRGWQADKNVITALEQLERQLFLQLKLKRAMQLARLYGGAALILGVDQGQPEDELIFDTLGKNCLRFVHVVHRYELSCGPIIRDILSPYFNHPEYYERQIIGAVPVRLHPSRVIRLQGNELPDVQLSVDGWGDSVMQTLDDAIKEVGGVAGGIATMVTEAKVDVLSIPDLTKNISTQSWKDRLTARLSYANTAKSITNTLVLDDKETWQRITQSFSELPDVLKMYLLIVSGAADIPVTRFLGQSPAGLNSTGEGDIRNYYDRIKSDQTTVLTPTISPLDEILIRSATGARDEGIHYNWRSLWQLDEVQRVAVAKSKADIFKIDVDSGMWDPQVLKDARENQLIEDGTYPGLEPLLEEAELTGEADLPDDPGQEGEDPRLIERQKQKLLRSPASLVKDAAPRTLYVSRKVINSGEILNWIKSQGFEDSLPANELHVTVAFSRTPLDWMKIEPEWNSDKSGQLMVPPGGARVVEELGDEGAVVLMFSSAELAWRWRGFKDAGASWDYDDYQPHVTLSYSKGAVDLKKVEPYRGKIVLGPEIFEEINTNADREVA